MKKVEIILNFDDFEPLPLGFIIVDNRDKDPDIESKIKKEWELFSDTQADSPVEFMTWLEKAGYTRFKEKGHLVVTVDA